MQKASTSASVGYMCRWEGCGQVFETTSDITTHVLYSSQHLKKEGGWSCDQNATSCDCHVNCTFHNVISLPPPYIMQVRITTTVVGACVPGTQNLEESESKCSNL